MNPTQLYLDLLKKCLTYWIWGETHYPLGGLHHDPSLIYRLCGIRHLEKLFALFGVKLVREQAMDPEKRREGRDWPIMAHTMIGLKRLDNLQFCAETVLRENIPGDFIETGVWRGGASIFMRGVLKAHGVTDRTVWIADSFQGLPPSDGENYPADAGKDWSRFDYLRVSLEQVQENFRRYGLWDDQVKPLVGWFKDTLPTAPIERLAVARLDGDMYESTMDALNALYPKLSPGGFLIVDDYAIVVCRCAVDDFRAKHGITAPIHHVDWSGVYWRKE